MADQPDWFTNPEHMHIIGLDRQLETELRSDFLIAALEVDCGVEGKSSFVYHFRISNVPVAMHGSVAGRAMDLLAEWTPYRFEVSCI
jgi:hypothetical protein